MCTARRVDAACHVDVYAKCALGRRPTYADVDVAVAHTEGLLLPEPLCCYAVCLSVPHGVILKHTPRRILRLTFQVEGPVDAGSVCLGRAVRSRHTC